MRSTESRSTGTGAKKIADCFYKDAVTGWSYTVAGTDLIVRKAGDLDQVLIRGWGPNKNLGITLDETRPNAGAEHTFSGDYGKQVNPSDPTRYVFDAFGNYASDGVQAIGDDVLYGTLAVDVLRGLMGNDALDGSSGDDLVEGGDGDDLLFGGLGADNLIGGAGRDFIYGSGIGALTFPGTSPTLRRSRSAPSTRADSPG